MRDVGLFGVTIYLQDGIGDRFSRERGANWLQYRFDTKLVSCNESKVRREWKRKYIRSTDDRSTLDPKTNYTATEQRRSEVRIDCRLLVQLGASKRLYACYFWHLRPKE
jgi:hypothetical protein